MFNESSADYLAMMQEAYKMWTQAKDVSGSNLVRPLNPSLRVESAVKKSSFIFLKKLRGGKVYCSLNDVPIKVLCGNRSYNVVVNLGWKTETLERALSTHFELHDELVNHWFSHCGKPLRSGVTLYDQNVQVGSTIIGTLRLRGGSNVDHYRLYTIIKETEQQVLNETRSNFDIVKKLKLQGDFFNVDEILLVNALASVKSRINPVLFKH